MKCTFNFQAGGSCKREVSHLVDGIPLCKTHATVIAYRLSMQYRKFTYEKLGWHNPLEINEELRNRTCFICNGYVWITERDICPICVGTGFSIL